MDLLLTGPGVQPPAGHAEDRGNGENGALHRRVNEGRRLELVFHGFRQWAMAFYPPSGGMTARFEGC